MKPSCIERSTLLIKHAFQNPFHIPAFLCLDAPLVAAGWALVLSMDSHPKTDWLAICGLFSAVWCIYLVDRLWDVRKGRNGHPLTLRHQFAASNQRLLLGLAITATLGAFFLVLPEFDPAKLRNAAWLGIVVLIYFLIFRLLRQSPARNRWLKHIPGKELAIGICFSGGIFIASGASLRSAASIALFVGMAILFSLNCLLIAEAEISIDREFDSASFFVRNGARALPYPVLLAIPAIAGGFALFPGSVPLSAISLIFCSFLTLATAIKRFRPGHLQVQPVADAVLLIPWITAGIVSLSKRI